MTEPCLVVRVRPNALQRALDNLKNQGCNCYSPQMVERSPRRPYRMLVYPLFPGYVFVWPPGDAWGYIRSTVGVLDVLMAGRERPAWMPGAEVDRILAMEVDGLVRLSAPAAAFDPGESVRVDRGAVTGPAIVEGMSGPDRVRVLMEILGRWTRTSVDVADVARE